MLTESKRIVSLGLPLIAAQLFQMGTGVADTIMAGRYDPIHLAGVAVGTALLWPLMMLFNGTLSAVIPVASQLHGAQRTGEIGEFVRQGIWVALICAAIMIAIFRVAETLFVQFGIDPATAAISADYLGWTGLGVGPLLIYFLVLNTCNALGHTNIAMLIAAISFVFKLCLSYCLIYGEFGFPELGGPGTAAASACGWWLQFALIIFITQRAWFQPVGLFARFSAPDLLALKRYLSLGLPIGILRFFEVAFFSCIALMLAKIGPWAVAAHQIALNINAVLFMVAVGLGNAANVVIGNHVGAERLHQAHLAARAIILVTLTYSVACALFLAPMRVMLVSLYTTDKVVLDVAANLLWFVVVYQLVDNAQVTAISALRGFKDTRVPMFIALSGYWLIGFPVSLSLGTGSFGLPNWGIYGYWAGLCVSFFVVGVVANARLLLLSSDPVRIRQLAHL